MIDNIFKPKYKGLTLKSPEIQKILTEPFSFYYYEYEDDNMENRCVILGYNPNEEVDDFEVGDMSEEIFGTVNDLFIDLNKTYKNSKDSVYLDPDTKNSMLNLAIRLYAKIKGWRLS